MVVGRFDAATHRGLTMWAGHDYDKPRQVRAVTLDFFDFHDHTVDEIRERLDTFTLNTETMEVRAEFDQYGDYDGCGATARLVAYRLETPEEVEARIADGLAYLARLEREQRAKYEMLKRHYEAGR